MTLTILVLGAAGHTGLELLRHAASLPAKPVMHAFVRTPSKLSETDTALCAGVHQGDARHEADILRVLDDVKPDAIISVVGLNKLGVQTCRQDTAKAIFECVKPGARHEHVKVVVVSSIGASDTKMKMGFGMGVILSLVLKNILDDHTAMEAVLRNGFTADHAKRLLIVRPTALKNGKPTGKVSTFGVGDKPPTTKIDRADVAQYIIQQLTGDGPAFGSSVNITNSK